MHGFIEFQKAIYRSYALARYNSVNINKLSKEERDELELQIKVEEGSSLFGVDFQAAVEKFMDNVSNKLSKKDVMIIALVLSTGYFGTSSYKTYLEERRQIRQQELKSEEHMALIENLRFASEEETKRTKLITELAKQNSHVSNIQTYAHNAQTSLVKALRKSDTAEIAGVSIEGEVAAELVKNARKTSHVVRLDGTYRVLVVDSSNPDVFKIKVRDKTTKGEFIAIVQDETLDNKYKKLIQKAEWSKESVDLTINAKEVGGDIRQAIVMSAKETVSD